MMLRNIKYNSVSVWNFWELYCKWYSTITQKLIRCLTTQFNERHIIKCNFYCLPTLLDKRRLSTVKRGYHHYSLSNLTYFHSLIVFRFNVGFFQSFLRWYPHLDNQELLQQKWLYDYVWIQLYKILWLIMKVQSTQKLGELHFNLTIRSLF